MLNLKPKNFINYVDLRDEFLKSLLSHYQKNPHQYQSGKNSLTKAFDQYKIDSNWNDLLKTAEKNIYNNVFDAFHNVGGGSIKKEHILFEHLPNEKKLVLIDNINAILEQQNLIEVLKNENESRWMIVEEAWKNNLSPNFLVYNQTTEEFVSVSSTLSYLLGMYILFPLDEIVYRPPLGPTFIIGWCCSKISAAFNSPHKLK